MVGNGFAYDTAGLERLHRLALEAPACESAVGSGAASTYFSALPNFSIKLGNLILAKCDRCIICVVGNWRFIFFA